VQKSNQQPRTDCPCRQQSSAMHARFNGATKHGQLFRFDKP
jgi:hypothetical protein